MLWFHETRHIDERTGYGGSYQSLYLSLAKLFPSQVMAHPRECFRLKPDIDVEIFFGQPYEHFEKYFQRRVSEHKGVFTMWEYDRINPDLLFCIEKYFDFVVVPTEYCRRVFQQHLPDHPVYVVPLGVNPELYPLLTRKPNREPFTALWQGFVVHPDRKFNRKRVDLVQQAFDELKLPNARLVVKGMRKATRFGVSIYHSLDPRYSLISDELSHAELLSLWQQCDLGINPSEGEGVGLIPLEWMATGMAVSLANNSGAAEFCDPAINYPLQCRDQVPSINDEDWLIPVPSVEEIKEVIHHCYYNREEAWWRGQQAAQWIRNNYTYDHAAVALMNLCAQLTGKVEQCTSVA